MSEVPLYARGRGDASCEREVPLYARGSLTSASRAAPCPRPLFRGWGLQGYLAKKNQAVY